MLPTVDSDSHSDSDSSSSPHTSACTQCGGRVFDEVDGQLYCRNCSTLSQSQTQVLEDADRMGLGARGRGGLRMTTPKKKKRKKKDDKDDDTIPDLEKVLLIYVQAIAFMTTRAVQIAVQFVTSNDASDGSGGTNTQHTSAHTSTHTPRTSTTTNTTTTTTTNSNNLRSTLTSKAVHLSKRIFVNYLRAWKKAASNYPQHNFHLIEAFLGDASRGQSLFITKLKEADPTGHGSDPTLHSLLFSRHAPLSFRNKAKDDIITVVPSYSLIFSIVHLALENLQLGSR